MGVAKVRAHAHLGHRHRDARQHRIVDLLLAEDVHQRVTNQLARAQLPLRRARRSRAAGGLGLLMEISLETASLCALVSMDSTMRSNITVGPPIELDIYHRDSLNPGNHYIYEEGSEYLRELKRSWDRNLKEAFCRLPQVAWSTNWDNLSQEKKNT